MIVKIQRPLGQSSPVTPQALIHDAGETFRHLVDFTEVEHLFTDLELKIFCHAEIRETILHIGDRAPDQPW